MSRVIVPQAPNGVIAQLPSGAFLIVAGTSVPTDGTAGYSPGCLYQKTDGGDGTSLYLNEGTVSSCDFNAINPS